MEANDNQNYQDNKWSKNKKYLVWFNIKTFYDTKNKQQNVR
jgi:hypothetical protein